MGGIITTSCVRVYVYTCLWHIVSRIVSLSLLLTIRGYALGKYRLLSLSLSYSEQSDARMLIAVMLIRMEE